MNILVLSAGTRNKLIEYFMRPENGVSKVVTTDCSMYAPAIYYSSCYYIVPKMKSDDYIPTLIRICQDERINVILPLQEDELEIISTNRRLFENLGVLVCVSPVDTLLECRDKYFFSKKLKEQKIPTVDTLLVDEIDCESKASFPLILKERRGCGSVGNLIVYNYDMLCAFAREKEQEMIAQPYLSEAEEYGVDAYVDIVSGELTEVFIKKKIRMRAGETEKAISIKDDKIFVLVDQLIEIWKFRGPLDIDILKYKDEYFVLEVNPRFGGGYPLAYECGVNFISDIVSNANGTNTKRKIGNYYSNVLMLKYTDVIIKDEDNML